MSGIPTPGHPDAVAIGCTCPRMDNGHGQGFKGPTGEQVYWHDGECPVHVLHGVECPDQYACATTNQVIGA